MKHTKTLILFLSLSAFAATVNAAQRPNVIVIMSDDQGVGDYGFIGNDTIRTPHLDAMRDRGGYLSNFYVSPVCAPTRASLMTGRYNYRTRCIDTYKGRAMMDTTEVTIAEVLADAGYRTGIYGKWHLGDCYPMRPMDQGFDESLIHRGGGIGQRSDPIGAEGKYTDPILFKNGVATPTKGYCTDVYFDAAMEFIATNVESGEPFFTYIATNAPHGPFHDVPEDLYQKYKDIDFSPILVDGHHPKNAQKEFDTLARIAAMITNIDENIGRLFIKLDQLGVTDNTIVVYLNDNGPNTWRFVGDRRGKKGGVDEGGVRSPLLFHWPAKVASDRSSDQTCAHIDLMPTILDACDVDVQSDLALDGRSFLSLLTQENAELPDRRLVLQAHRGNRPVRYHHFTLLQGPWKLVHPTGFQQEKFNGKPKFELYHLEDDPQQTTNLADSKPDVLNRLKSDYDTWFDAVGNTRPNNYAPPRIVIGTRHETRTVLTAQDLRTPNGGEKERWMLKVASAGTYQVELIVAEPLATTANATVTIGEQTEIIEIPPNQQRGHFLTIDVPEGKQSLSAHLATRGKSTPIHQVVISIMDESQAK